MTGIFYFPIQKLYRALIESDCPYFKQRVLILILREEGKTYQEIANLLGCSQRTAYYWCIHGDPGNIESLRDKRREGNYRKATKTYIQLLIKVAKKDPSQLGCNFDRWTGERLANYLSELTDIKLSRTQIINILKETQITFWAKRREIKGEIDRDTKTEFAPISQFRFAG